MAQPSTTRLMFRRIVYSLLAAYAVGLVVVLLLRLSGVEWPLLGLLYSAAFHLFLPVVAGYALGLLLRAQRLTALYLLLLVAGLMWMAPRLAPRPPAAAQDDTFSLITFNAFPENTRLHDAENWLIAQQADVIALQELAQPFAALQAAYPYHVSDQGSALFSRFPILHSAPFALEDTPQQRAVLEISGRAYPLYNVHLFMPLSEDESLPLLLRYDERRRDAQISALLAMAAAESDPVLVVGDFNMSEFSPVYERLAQQMSDAYRAASWGLGATWPGGASEEMGDLLPPMFRLDYVWYSPGFTALHARIGPRLGSDHLPLLVSLSAES